jgi:hypothetical protein
MHVRGEQSAPSFSIRTAVCQFFLRNRKANGALLLLDFSSAEDISDCSMKAGQTDFLKQQPADYPYFK